MVLNELRSVLVGKAAEMEEREALAVARQSNLEICDEADDISVAQNDGDRVSHAGVEKGDGESTVTSRDPFLICHNLLNGYASQLNNGFEDSFVTAAMTSDDGQNAKVNGDDRASSDEESSSSSDDEDAESCPEEDPSTVKSVSSATNSVLTHSSLKSARGSKCDEDDNGTDTDYDSSECDTEDAVSLSGGGGGTRVKVRSSSIVPRSVPHGQQVTSVQSEGGTLADLRSISTPDINLLANYEAASPYQSLESLRRREKNKKVVYMGPASSSSSDDSSDDDGDGGRGPMLGMYKKPQRPAAVRQPGTPPSRKRDRNRTVGLKSGESENRNGGVNSSSYVARRHNDANPLFMPPPPPKASSLQANIAAQAAARAAAVNGAAEEVFGSSDSD